MPQPQLKPVPRELSKGEQSALLLGGPEAAGLVEATPPADAQLVQASHVAGLQLSREKVELLKRTVAQGATDDELELFVHICNKTGLDPFAKQIHAIKRRQKVNGQWTEVMTFQTGIDGYRLIADRTGRYAPGREPTFTYDAQGNLVSATAYVKKFVAGAWHEYSATAFWKEYAQKNNQGELVGLWRTMPHNQLAKCAEALTLRRGFPAELSGVYVKEELDQAGNPGTGAESGAAAARPTQQRPAETPAGVSQKALIGFFRKCGFQEEHRGDRLTLARAVLGREVTTFGDLSDADRSRLYQALRFVRKTLAEQWGDDDGVETLVVDFARFTAPLEAGALSTTARVRRQVRDYLDARSQQ